MKIKNRVTFLNGPWGSGKTHMALQMVEGKQYEIIRPYHFIENRINGHIKKDTEVVVLEDVYFASASILKLLTSEKIIVRHIEKTSLGKTIVAYAGDAFEMPTPKFILISGNEKLAEHEFNGIEDFKMITCSLPKSLRKKL